MRKRETIDWIGGPSSPADEHGPAHSVVSLGAIDPTVVMGTLEELLTGRPFLEKILKAPGRKPVAIRDEGERLVIPSVRGWIRRWPPRRTIDCARSPSLGPGRTSSEAGGTRWS